MNRSTQLIPAEPGWLALFEEWNGEEISIHAEPVVAWRIETGTEGDTHHAVGIGHAVIGAGPWISGADSEKTACFFALVRESQLEPEFLQELQGRAHHSREELLNRAEQHHELRRQGHSTWLHDRRTQRSEHRSKPPTKLF